MEERIAERKKNPAAREKGYLINILILCAISIFSLLTAAVVLLWPFYYTEKDVARAGGAARDQVLDSLREGLSSGETALQAIRDLYPDHVVVDDNGVFSFYEIDGRLTRNEFLPEDFARDGRDYLIYAGPGGFRSETGIALPEGAAAPDWEEALKNEVTFAFLSLGRFNSKSELIPNTQFPGLLVSAEKAGIRPCVSVTVTPTDEETGKSQAMDIIRSIREADRDFEGTVAIYVRSYADEEDPEIAVRRTEGVKKILDMLKGEGFDPVVGGDLKALCGSVRLRSLRRYSTWVADYTDDPYYPYAFRFWTYGSSVQLTDSDYSAFLIMELISE